MLKEITQTQTNCPPQNLISRTFSGLQDYIFKFKDISRTFQGSQKFKDFSRFSRIATNPVLPLDHAVYEKLEVMISA